MAAMGNKDELPERLSPESEAAFPNLVKSGYIVTSRASTLYNCIAYAAGDGTKKWDPYGGYWPPGARKGWGIEALASAFEQLGYEKCAGFELEEGYERVALFVDHLGEWQHASLQLEDGSWSSKLGKVEDIKHKSPHVLNSSVYGQTMYCMKRPRQTTTEEIALVPHDQFKEELRKLVNVPRAEIEEKLSEYEQQKPEKKSARKGKTK